MVSRLVMVWSAVIAWGCLNPSEPLPARDDRGTPTPDAGTMSNDVDAGAPAFDGGPDDGGAPTRDAGDSPRDAGARADAGFWRPDGGVPTFPGAVGFGSETPGGRGGTVLFVDNLNDSGPGSLRAALEARMPRIVLFRVSGTIEARSDLRIGDPYITVAGQTAPGGGITIKNAQLSIVTHDVVLRFLRIRTGDLVRADRDALSIVRAKNVVIDHCSFSYGVDEVLSVADSTDITSQWNLIAFPLHDSVHSEGPHGKCSLVRGTERATLHHNAYVHCPDRSPHLSAKRTHPPRMQVINNLSYDSGDSAGKIEARDDPNPTPGDYEFRHNLYLPGSKSRSEIDLKNPMLAGSRVFIDGNLGWRRTTQATDSWSLVTLNGQQRSDFQVTMPRLPYAGVVAPAEALENLVLPRVGAVLPFRDLIDTKAVDDVRLRREGWVDTPQQAGGWPNLPGAMPPIDTDADGMPDSWETARGLNPSQADGMSDRDGDGYPELENYLNELVRSAF